jgi:hypothetical protein
MVLTFMRTHYTIKGEGLRGLLGASGGPDPVSGPDDQVIIKIRHLINGIKILGIIGIISKSLVQPVKAEGLDEVIILADASDSDVELPRARLPRPNL